MKGIERLTVIANTYRTLVQLDASTELLDHTRKTSSGRVLP